MAEHAHDHGLTASGRHKGKLQVVVAITASILLIQVVGALLSGSIALIADAGHMFTDVGGITLALVAINLAARPATSKRTFGLVRAEILAAAANGAVLLVLGGYVLYESLGRLAEPPAVQTGTMLAFGLIGLVGNVVSMAVLIRVKGESLNLQGAFLEVATDTLGSVGVVAAAVISGLTGFTRADAIAALLIVVLIVPRALRLLRKAVNVLLEGTPEEIDPEEVRRHILTVPRVTDVHDLHVWTLTSGMPVLSAHVVIENDCFADGAAPRMLDSLQHCLAGHFDVEHSTFQLEPETHADHEHPAHA